MLHIFHRHTLSMPIFQKKRKEKLPQNYFQIVFKAVIPGASFVSEWKEEWMAVVNILFMLYFPGSIIVCKTQS